MESEDWLNSKEKLHQHINNFKDYYKSWKHWISSTSKVLTIWILLSFKVPSTWCSHIFAAPIKSCSMVNLLASFCVCQALSVFLLLPVLVRYCSFFFPPPAHIWHNINFSFSFYRHPCNTFSFPEIFPHLQVLPFFFLLLFLELCKIHACRSYVF